jgi:MFS family permease
MMQSPIIQRQSRRTWLALAVIVAAQFMVVLDIAIVNVALPAIKGDLHFSQANLQWVISAYAILFGGVLLLGGRLSDVFGGACSCWAWPCSRSARCCAGCPGRRTP